MPSVALTQPTRRLTKSTRRPCHARPANEGSHREHESWRVRANVPPDGFPPTPARSLRYRRAANWSCTSITTTALVVAVLAFGRTGSAELSATEKKEFVNQVDAINWLSSAAGDMTAHLELHPEDARAVRDIVGLLGGEQTGARFNHFQALVWLAGGIGDSATPGGRAFWTSLDRGQAIERAFEALDAAYPYYVRADQDIERLMAACPSDCSNLEKALADLRKARARYDSFDRSLPYVEPRLDVVWAHYADEAGVSPASDGHRRLLDLLMSTEQSLENAWNDSTALAVLRPLEAGSVARSGQNYRWLLWRIGWALGLVVGAEHPAVAREIDALALADTSASSRSILGIGFITNLLSSIDPGEDGVGLSDARGLPLFYTAGCVDRTRLLQRSTFSDVVQTIGRELEHLCDAHAFSDAASWKARSAAEDGAPALDPPRAVNPPPAVNAPPAVNSSPVVNPVPGPNAVPVPLPLPPPPPPPPPTGTLANGSWVSVPGSEMRSIYQPALDQQPGWPSASFDGVQDSWSSATCVGDELVAWGGGHTDSANNGVFAVNVTNGRWRRITNPSSVWQQTNAGAPNYCPDPDGDGVHTCVPPFGPSCDYGSCNVMPDGTPSSRHTYDLISNDGNFLYDLSGAIWSGGNQGVGPRSWKLSLSTGAWTAITDRTGGTMGTGGTAYLNGKIYHAFTSFNASTYDVASDTWVNGSLQKPIGVHSQLLYVPTVNRLYALGGGAAWSIPVASWPSGPSTDLGPTGLAAQANGVGLTYYPPEDLILLWDGGRTIQTLDPHTGAWGSVTPGGVDPGAATSTGTWGRFSYCANKLVLVTGVDKPLYFVNTGTPPPPPPPPPGTDNFAARCNAAGVVFCDPLDTEGPWGENHRLLKNPDGTQGIPTQEWNHTWRGVHTVGPVLPQLDTSVKASGSGSLKFTYQSLTGEGGAGNFVTNFSDDPSGPGAVTFGENSTFYVQYRWRANCDFIYLDCNPASPTYKTTRRTFAATGGGITAFKTIIISGADVNLPINQPHCDFLQIVVNHSFDHALSAYQSCEWYSRFDALTGENFGGHLQFDIQPNGAPLGLADANPPTCWYVPGAPGDGSIYGWGHTGPACFYFEPDQWMTVQVMVHIGTWQHGRTGPKTSHITVWAAHEGEPQTKIIDVDFYADQKFSYEKYGKVVLLPLMTAKDPTAVHPTGLVWYDELIVSESFIQDPQ